MSSPSSDPTQVSIAELTLMVLRDTLKPNLVQFGAAIPHPDLLPTAKLNRILASVVRRVDVSLNICGAPEGWQELRVQVAQRAFAAGCRLSPDDIIITSGCIEAISLALHTVCQPGDVVAVESPTYFGILQALESQGLTALEIPTDCNYGMSLDALRFALDHHPVRACPTIKRRRRVALCCGFKCPIAPIGRPHRRVIINQPADQDPAFVGIALLSWTPDRWVARCLECRAHLYRDDEV